MLEMHLRRHLEDAESSLVCRGETCHLRCTRFFKDPEIGSPMPGQEARVARLGKDLETQVVTRKQVLEDFASIEQRGEMGIYPGGGPRKLAELELDALRNHPNLSTLWLAAAGHNSSVRRSDFESVGGFFERMMPNEHRELYFRLCEKELAWRLSRTPSRITLRTGWAGETH